MAKRKLEVFVVGDAASLKRALGSGGKAAKQFGEDVEAANRKVARSNRQAESSFDRLGRGAKRGAGIAVGALKTMAKTGGLLAASGFALGMKSTVSFEKQLSSLGAVAGATSKEMEALRKQALKAGADTAYSASQAALAQTELAKGGLSAAQILSGGLKSALSLAAAGELELGEAASYTANAMNLFAMRGAESQKVADAMATAANSTTADVADFGIALAQGGMVAKSAGYSFTETMVALEAMAASGLKGSDAGTSLKSALVALLKPSEQQAEAAAQLGLKFIDANGNMKSMADLSAHLRDRLGGMTKAQRTAALATVAGTDGVRQLTALYDAGPAKIQKWSAELSKTGTAAEVARQKQDNLAGDAEKLKGTLETAAISVGSKLTPALRTATQGIDHFISGVQNGTGAGGRFAAGVSSAFNSAKVAVGTAVNAIRGFLQRNRSDINSVAAAFRNVGKVISVVFQGVVLPVIKRILPGMAQQMQGMVRIVRGAVRIIAGVLTLDFGKAWDGVKDIFGGALKSLGGLIRAATAGFREVAARAGQGIARGFRSAIGSVRSAVTNVVRGAQNVLRGVIKWFVEIGKDIVLGIVRGIKAAADGVADAVHDVAEGAVNVARDVLDIGSPSRVFHTIGEQIVQGFANGMSSSAAVAKAGLKAGLLFPIEAAIAELQAERERLEASFAAADRKRERQGLLGAIRSARRGELVTVGSLSSIGGDGGSSSGGVKPKGKNIVEALSSMARQFGLTVTSTTGGKHAPGSHHYRGQAIDAAGSAKQMAAFFDHLKKNFGPKLAELFYDPRGGIKNGRSIGAIGGHSDHVHVAATSLGALTGGRARGASGGGGRKKSKLSPNEIRGLAYAAGFRGKALDTMVAIVMAESGGRVNASNRNSDGSIDRGLAQINSVHGKRSTFDPAANLRAAFAISKGGRDFDPWVAFQRGLHRRHMGDVGSGSGAEVGGIGSYRTRKVDKNAVKDSVRALKDFNREGARAARLAAIDLKIAGLEKLKAYTEAIADLRTQMKDAAATAASTFRQGLERSIDAALAAKLAAVKASPQAAELAALLGSQSADAMAREDRDQARAVKDAEQALADLQDPRGEFQRRMARLRNSKSPAAQREYRDMVQQEKDAVQAVEDAKAAIRDTARSRRIDQLQQSITDMENAAQTEADIARAALDQQEADHRASLENQLGALVGNLEARKITYAQYVQQVRAILGPYGQDFQGSAETQQTLAQNVPLMNALNQMKVTARGVYRLGSSGKWIKIANSDGSPVGRASGGVLRPGVVYRTGELGPEDIHMGPDGRLRVTPASQSGGASGGGNVYIDHATIGSQRAAESMAHRLAFKLAHA